MHNTVVNKPRTIEELMKIIKKVEVKLKLKSDSDINQLNFCNHINEPMPSNRNSIETNPTIAQILKSLETLTTKVKQMTEKPQFPRNKPFRKNK